jgi:hypothetical protein
MEFPLWDLSRKPEFGSRIQPHQEANHDTAEAEKSSQESAASSHPKNLSMTRPMEMKSVSAIALSRL